MLKIEATMTFVFVKNTSTFMIKLKCYPTVTSVDISIVSTVCTWAGQVVYTRSLSVGQREFYVDTGTQLCTTSSKQHGGEYTIDVLIG